jgi:hypothetical protein
MITQSSQYIFQKNVLALPGPAGRLTSGHPGRRSIHRQGTHRSYENKELGCGILSGKVATFFRGLRPEKMAPTEPQKSEAEKPEAGIEDGLFFGTFVFMATDELSDYYSDLLNGSYDCVDRIVLNANFGLCYSAGAFAPGGGYCITAPMKIWITLIS